jgi:hypothetical protein
MSTRTIVPAAPGFSVMGYYDDLTVRPEKRDDDSVRQMIERAPIIAWHVWIEDDTANDIETVFVSPITPNMCGDGIGVGGCRGIEYPDKQVLRFKVGSEQVYPDGVAFVRAVMAERMAERMAEDEQRRAAKKTKARRRKA